MDSSEKPNSLTNPSASLSTIINFTPGGLNNETASCKYVPSEISTHPTFPDMLMVDTTIHQAGLSHIDPSFSTNINSSTIGTSLTNQHAGSLTYDLSESFSKFSQANSQVEHIQGGFNGQKVQTTQGVVPCTLQNVYTYPQHSDNKGLSSLQPTVPSTLQNMLPPEGNVYQPLQPLPHDLFDVPSISEPKVYQQLQPVSQNKYKMIAQPTVYQELIPVSAGGNRLQTVQGKVYQELTPVHQPGIMQPNTFQQPNPVTSMYNPTNYSSSKLYQQLSQPARATYQSDIKTYHELRPVTMNNFVQPRQPGKYTHHQFQTNVTPTGGISGQSRLNSYPKHHRIDHSNYTQTYQGATERSSLENVTLNNVRSPLGTFGGNGPQQGGFQMNKPKIYLELRNPTIRHQATAKQSNNHYSGVYQHPASEDNSQATSVAQNHHHVSDFARSYQEENHLLERPMTTHHQNKSRLPFPQKFSKILGPNSTETSRDQVLSLHNNHSVTPSMASQQISMETTTNFIQNTVQTTHSEEKFNTTPTSLSYGPVCYGDPSNSNSYTYQININPVTSNSNSGSVSRVQCVLDSTPSSTSTSCNLTSSPTSKLQELLLRNKGTNSRFNLNHTIKNTNSFQGLQRNQQFVSSNVGSLTGNSPELWLNGGQVTNIETFSQTTHNVPSELTLNLSEKNISSSNLSGDNFNSTNNSCEFSFLSSLIPPLQPNAVDKISSTSNDIKKGKRKFNKTKNLLDIENKLKKRKYTKTEKFYRRFKNKRVDINTETKTLDILEPSSNNNVNCENNINLLPDTKNDHSNLGTDEKCVTLKELPDIKNDHSNLGTDEKSVTLKELPDIKNDHSNLGTDEKSVVLKELPDIKNDHFNLGTTEKPVTQKDKLTKRKYVKSGKYSKCFKTKTKIVDSEAYSNKIQNKKRNKRKYTKTERFFKRFKIKKSYDGPEETPNKTDEIQENSKLIVTTNTEKDVEEVRISELNSIDSGNYPKKRKYTRRSIQGEIKSEDDKTVDEAEELVSEKYIKRKNIENKCEYASPKRKLRHTTVLEAKVKEELLDPLEEGLISDDEGEVVFLGFDMPDEEYDTILGFDLSSGDQDFVSDLLGQQELDCMTVECDPSLLLRDSNSPDGDGAMCDSHDTSTSSSGKRFSCPLCPRQFTTRAYAKKHVAVVHRRADLDLATFYSRDCALTFPIQKLWKVNENQGKKKSLHQCGKCLKSYVKFRNLQRHKCSETYPCAYCSQKFSSRNLLREHSLIHSEGAFECNVCDMKFTAATSLKKHRLLHVKEKLFRCEICQRSFSLLSTLKTHLLIHTGARQFPCKLCHKVFNRRDVLNAHQWVHTGEKNFQCDICLQKFRWRHAVKSHKLIYHSKEKPYVCEICGKCFSHPDSFKRHREVHSEKLFYCHICLKAFSRPSSVKAHITTHSDLKSFFCDLCNKGFRSKSHLRNHFLVHTKEKPWLCKFCNKTYKDRNQLRRHKRVVHFKTSYTNVLPVPPEHTKPMHNFKFPFHDDDEEINS